MIPISPIFTNFYQFLVQFSKNAQKIKGLDKTIPKIYICWGIVGDTNFSNFQQFSPIFGQISPISWHIIDRLDETIPKIYICWGQIPISVLPIWIGQNCVCVGGILKVTFRTDPSNLHLWIYITSCSLIYCNCQEYTCLRTLFISHQMFSWFSE